MTRVCIVGLDCLCPKLVLDSFWHDLPNFRGLAQAGGAAPMRSCDPPITIPAWSCMVTGCDPGMLGTYGFRDRSAYDYTSRRLANSSTLGYAPIWDILSQSKRRSHIIAVPQTYPPRPIAGTLVAGFPTPDPQQAYTYPVEHAAQLTEEFGSYCCDIENFRHTPPKQLLEQLYHMSRQRFAIFNSCLKRHDSDLIMMVDISSDRLHHAFWDDYQVVHDFYVYLDGQVGRILEQLRADDTLLVVSDHGAIAHEGGFAINQWLIEHGYLRLRQPPSHVSGFDPSNIDWQNTLAFADGGYVARIYLNQRGREPAGIADRSLLDALEEQLMAIGGVNGEQWKNQVLRPQTIYRELRGIAPDLMVYVDQFRRRALGSVGHPSCYVSDNDTGPDLANHAMHGIFMSTLALSHVTTDVTALKVQHVAPLVLRQLGIAPPPYMLSAFND